MQNRFFVFKGKMGASFSLELTAWWQLDQIFMFLFLMKAKA